MADSKKYDGSQWEHSLRKLTTATEAVENPLYSDGTAITAYTIKGNTVQSGTPTPDNPIMPEGTGERTGNIITNRITGVAINNSGVVQNASDYDLLYGKVESNKTYAIQLISSTIAYVIGYFTQEPVINGVTYDSSRTIINFNDDPTPTVTIPTGVSYIAIRVNSGKNVMVNEGSTIKPYEPYGYKIPISSGGVTTNIYLGSTQTTRKIKKLVLDGTENWSIAGLAPGQIPYFRIAYFTSAKPMKVVCTHYVSPNETISVSNQVEGVKVQTSSEAKIALMVRPPEFAVWSVDDFKSYLAQQYAAGTPVTVWYVLATEETAAVNEPLMKIGDYADTLSNATAIPTTEGANSIIVDTTVQPSEFTATWTGWRDASVKEWDGSDWQ